MLRYRVSALLTWGITRADPVGVGLCLMDTFVEGVPFAFAVFFGPLTLLIQHASDIYLSESNAASARWERVDVFLGTTITLVRLSDDGVLSFVRSHARESSRGIAI